MRPKPVFRGDEPHCVMWTVAQARALYSAWRQCNESLCGTSSSSGELPKPKYIDLGGEDGNFAGYLAQEGYDCLVVDKDDNHEAVNKRDRMFYKAFRGAAGKIKFHQADVLELDSTDLVTQCNNENPVLVTTTNLLHLIPRSGTEHMFDVVSNTLVPGGIFYIFYNVCDDPRITSASGEFFQYEPEEIIKLAKVRGFTNILQRQESSRLGDEKNGVDVGYIELGFRLINPPEKNRQYGQQGLLRAPSLSAATF